MIECTKDKEGFNGTFFIGSKYPYSVVIRVAGSGAGRNQIISSSKFLIEAGFSVLCLGYQQWDSKEKQFSPIPIDYVLNAIEWLNKYLDTDKLKLGMTGISMGALYTLISAIYIPQIASIALASPFDIVMEGLSSSLTPTGHSTFSWKGHELPFHSWKILKKSKFILLIKALFDKRYGMHRLLRYVYDNNKFSASPSLPLENISTNILLLASKNDDCWPSDEAVSRIVDRISSTSNPNTIEYHIYEYGCHNLGGNMTMNGFTGIKMRLLMKSWKTHPKECQDCIKDSRQRIVDFFRRTII